MGLTSPDGKISSTSGPPRRAAHQTHSWPHPRRTGMLERGHAPNASLCAAVPLRVRARGRGAHQLGRSRCQGPGSPPASMPLRTLALFCISGSRRTRRAANGASLHTPAALCRLPIRNAPLQSVEDSRNVRETTTDLNPDAKYRRLTIAALSCTTHKFYVLLNEKRQQLAPPQKRKHDD